MTTSTIFDNEEIKELCKRNLLLEQENEVVRRAAVCVSLATLSGKALPARKIAGRRRNFCGGIVQVIELSRQPYTAAYNIQRQKLTWHRRR